MIEWTYYVINIDVIIHIEIHACSLDKATTSPHLRVEIVNQ